MVEAIAGVMNGRPAELVSFGEEFWNCELATGYTAYDWISSADPDLKRLLVGVATQTDLPQEAGNALSDRFHRSEFHVSGASEPTASLAARGLGAAFLLHGIGASLPSDGQWDRTRIPLRHQWLDDDCCEREANVEVLHVAEPRHVEEVSGALLRRSQQALAEGRSHDFADRKRVCFPHLRFGTEVDGQFAKVPQGYFARFVWKLVDLDHACMRWRRSEAARTPEIPSSPESEPTMQQYGHLRVFPDHERRNQTYEQHVRVGQAYRIHFRVVHKSKEIEIGYVGPHLPTKNHPKL